VGEVHPSLRWLVDVIWGGTEDVRAVLEGPVPDGYRVVESYAVIPSLARPRFLVSVESRRSAAASLRRYNSLRPPVVRTAREAASLLVRAGLGGRVFGGPLLVCVPGSLPDDRLGSILLVRHLERALGSERVLAAFGVGRQGPNRKPVAQLFSLGGRPVAYVKVGWNAFTAGLVRNEALTLRELNGTEEASLWIPRVMHEGAWRGLALSAVSPLPRGVSRLRPLRQPPPLQVTRAVTELGSVSRGSLSASPYLARLRARIANLGGDVALPAERLLARIEGEHGRATLPVGRWHGDWVPWNLAIRKGHLAAWDWEHSAAHTPVGFDLVHFYTSVAFLHDRLPLPRSLEWGRRASLPSLRGLGMDHDAAAAAGRLYAAELYVRFEEAAAAGAGRNPRVYPAILGEMAEAAGA